MGKYEPTVRTSKSISERWTEVAWHDTLRTHGWVNIQIGDVLIGVIGESILGLRRGECRVFEIVFIFLFIFLIHGVIFVISGWDSTNGLYPDHRGGLYILHQSGK